MQLHTRFLQRHSWRQWVRFYAEQRAGHAAQELAIQHHVTAVCSRVFGAWRRATSARAETRRRLQRLLLHRKRRALQSLARACRVSARQREQDAFAAHLAQQRARRVRGDAFRMWVLAARRRSWARRVAAASAGRRQWSLARRALAGWRAVARGSATAALQDALVSAQGVRVDVERESSRADEVQLENTRLIERVHELTDTVSQLQTAVRQRQQEMAMATSALQEGAVRQGALHSAAAVAEARVGEWEAEVARLRAEVATAQEEKQAAEVRAAVAAKRHETVVQGLERDVEVQYACAHAAPARW